MKRLIKKIVDEIRRKDLTRDELELIKTKISSEFCEKIPSNEEILACLNEKDREKFVKILQKKPYRTVSGVSIIAVMCKPEKCPHGSCVYCPTIEHIPKSYSKEEPAVMRGLAYGYDPYKQVRRRIEQLGSIGHPVSKIELIIMGGTFTSRPIRYQENFVKSCFDAMNGFVSKNLLEAHKFNENAAHRCVGLTIETRPDYAKKKEINNMINFGATRLEIGVQTLDDEIYKIVRRGHTVEDVVEATQLAKDSGLKVCYHIMPNLPGSDPEKDLKIFKMLFEDERFRPDMLKIYPTLVVEGSELVDWYMDGKYKPYSDTQLINLLVKMKAVVPEWVRIMRLQRDVPAKYIIAGCKFTNLREIVQKQMAKKGLECRCIRCREIGHKKSAKGRIKLKKTEYEASGGKEIFIQYVKGDALLGLLRLRFPFEPFRNELKNSGIVRELRVFGPSVPVGQKMSKAIQHKGLGKKLLEKVEEICVDQGFSKIAVNSGVGVREYYRKLGYDLEGMYMIKKV
jgi:elongator complex protein 3